MSVVNSIRNKANYKPQFWWEEGYTPSDPQEEKNNTTEATKNKKFDGNGEDYELSKFTTDLNHMDGTFFHNSNTFISLRHQRSRSASIALFTYSAECGLTQSKVYEIGDNSGYIGLSFDDTILAVGVLKEDYIMIFDVQTGELLINITGGYKVGYFGQLQFLPGNFNNSLLETRVIAMDKQGKVKESVVRSWDLGFKGPINSSSNEDENNDDDDDEDEETKKLWEIKKRGAIKCSQSKDGTALLCATELLQKLEWLDRSSGSMLRQLSFESWISKPIISKNGLYVATSHLGGCMIHSIQSGELIYVLKNTENDSNYPLVPIQFICNDEVIVCRINQDRTLILSFFQSHSIHNAVTIRSVGGTITDNTVQISSDEKFLMCWPYGVLELYSMERMIALLYHQMRVAVRFELMKIRLLLNSSRATLKETNQRETSISTTKDSQLNEVTSNMNHLQINSKSSSKKKVEISVEESTTHSSSYSSSKTKKEGKKSSLKSTSQPKIEENKNETEVLVDSELYNHLMKELNINELFQHILSFV